MTVSPDDVFATAEYALGTLDASERETYRTRRGQFNAEYSRFSRSQPGGSWHEFVQHASASRIRALTVPPLE